MRKMTQSGAACEISDRFGLDSFQFPPSAEAVIIVDAKRRSITTKSTRPGRIPMTFLSRSVIVIGCLSYI